MKERDARTRRENFAAQNNRSSRNCGEQLEQLGEQLEQLGARRNCGEQLEQLGEQLEQLGEQLGHLRSHSPSETSDDSLSEG